MFLVGQNDFEIRVVGVKLFLKIRVSQKILSAHLGHYLHILYRNHRLGNLRNLLNVRDYENHILRGGNVGKQLVEHGFGVGVETDKRIIKNQNIRFLH